MNPVIVSFSLLLAFLSTLLGLRFWQSAEYPLWLWGTLLALSVLAGALCVPAKTKRFALPVLGALAGIAFAVLCVQRTTHLPAAPDIDWYADERRVTVHGRVLVTDIREGSARYTIETLRMTDTQGETTTRGKTLVISRSLWPRAHVGDEIAATGTLERPEAFDGFAYDDYLSAFGVYALMRPKSIEVLKPRQGFDILAHLAHSRENVTARISTLLPEPHASLMDGLLTGNRSAVPEAVLEDFATAGLTHVLAISGYNIGIVLSLIAGALFFLPLRWRLIPSILAVAAFTLFVGASASVVRAAVMGILGLIALHAGRINDARLGTLWAAFFMLAWNPKYAWFDPSFQLSFLAVAGLIELQPILSERMKRVPETLGIRDALALTIAAQIFAAPWAALLFGRVSLIAPVANVFIAPLVPLTMLLGAVSLVADWVWHPLGQIVALGGWVTIQAMLTIAHIAARVPLASFSLPSVESWHLIAYYALLAATLVAWNVRCAATRRR